MRVTLKIALVAGALALHASRAGAGHGQTGRHAALRQRRGNGNGPTYTPGEPDARPESGAAGQGKGLRPLLPGRKQETRQGREGHRVLAAA